MDGRKVGLLRSFSADGQRHALLLRNVGLPRLSRCLGVACLFRGCACLGLLCVCAKWACRPSFAACYSFPACQSFCAHVVSCIFPVLSFDVGMLPVVCCMRCGFSAFVACDVVILLFPCCMQKPPLGGARGAVPGPSLPPTARSLGLLRRASGKYLTRHLTPLLNCQRACMIHDPCLDCVLPLNTCELMVHLPFHAPNRQGCPSGRKHQEGLVFPSSPQGVSKGFPSSPRDKG